MLCVLEMMRRRDIVVGRLDESSQDPLKNGHKNLGPSLLAVRPWDDK